MTKQYDAQSDPMLASMLETLGPDRLKALLVWFAAEGQTMETASERLSALLDDMSEELAQDTDAEQAYEQVASLTLEDRVRFMLLQEFGSKFTSKQHFDWLTQAAVKRLQGK